MTDSDDITSLVNIAGDTGDVNVAGRDIKKIIIENLIVVGNIVKLVGDNSLTQQTITEDDVKSALENIFGDSNQSDISDAIEFAGDILRGILTADLLDEQPFHKNKFLDTLPEMLYWELKNKDVWNKVYQHIQFKHRKRSGVIRKYVEGIWLDAVTRLLDHKSTKYALIESPEFSNTGAILRVVKSAIGRSYYLVSMLSLSSHEMNLFTVGIVSDLMRIKLESETSKHQIKQLRDLLLGNDEE